MADDQQPTFSICTLKMNINCCQKCPLILERRLLKSNEVESVTIDLDKGLVTVSGEIDPVVLIQKIKKMGKEAKLWFFQQKPDCDKQAGVGECSKSGLKIECGSSSSSSSSTESGSNNEDDRQLDWHSQHKCETETTGTKEYGSGFHSLPAMPSNVHARSYYRSLPSAMSSNVHARCYYPSSTSAMFSNVHPYSYSQSLPRFGYRPTRPYQQSVPGHRLAPHSYYSQQPHPPPAYRRFQLLSPPRDNPMVHYSDYADNYRLY